LAGALLYSLVLIDYSAPGTFLKNEFVSGLPSVLSETTLWELTSFQPWVEGLNCI
jgi:hypothetical protein